MTWREETGVLKTFLGHLAKPAEVTILTRRNSTGEPMKKGPVIDGALFFYDGRQRERYSRAPKSCNR